MAVEKLDLQSIWSSGQTYDAWLKACDEFRRADIESITREVQLSAADVQFLKDLKRPVHILAIAEDWCGDVRKNVPVIAKMCEQNPAMLRLRCVDKETKPQLMVRYLTNAAEAIPIVIFFNENFVEVGNWGPRPTECKRIMARGKAAGKIDDAREKIHAFYAADKHQSTIREMRELIDIAASINV
ncbi:MAG TPA: thioredoxin family protein [Planctomycetota bacterium]|nr:thioredoxin family protein [Planctomycetota bacterium]